VNESIDEGSVTAPAGDRADRGALWPRRVFWVLFALLAAIKLVLAASLAPFVDEAFYWQESRHLALAYSDLPPLTAWLIRFGEWVFGHGTLAMRAPFLLLGALLPLVMVWFVSRLAGSCEVIFPYSHREKVAARRMRVRRSDELRALAEPSPAAARHPLPEGEGTHEFAIRAGWIAGIWTMLLPLAGTLGVLALPDVPLTLAALVALAAFARATTAGRPRDWLLLGAALAFTALAHYRVAMLLLAGLVFLVATPRGRAQWCRPGLWAALAIAAPGFVPMLVFNLRHDWSGLAFQAVDRQDWGFHAAALIQPLEQALVTTPLLWLLLLGVLVAALRRVPRGAPWDLVGTSAAVFVFGWFAFGLFGDAERFRVHWPLPGWLALIALLPRVVSEWRERVPARSMRIGIAATATTTALGTGLILAYLACAAWPPAAAALARHKAYPEHFAGWEEIAGTTRRLLAAPRYADAILVADNFMLAAELDFALDGARPVFSLDHPLNAKHGRATQLAIWARDETALRAFAGQPVVLVVAETATRERERRAWLASVCSRVADLTPLDRVDLDGGRKRMALYAGNVPARSEPRHVDEECIAWQAHYAAASGGDVMQ
jgi:4-amino-4-deoxy-L-arabinose transferase-like glycosyltransferase